MLIQHTMYSHACSREVTLTLVLPDSWQASAADQGQSAVPPRFPLLFLVGDTGTESSWWMRSTFLESDINRPQTTCAAVGIQALDNHDCPALLKELSVLLPAMYPLSFSRQYVLTWGRSSSCLSALNNVFPRETLFAEPDVQQDPSAVLGRVLSRISSLGNCAKEERQCEP